MPGRLCTSSIRLLRAELVSNVRWQEYNIIFIGLECGLYFLKYALKLLFDKLHSLSSASTAVQVCGQGTFPVVPGLANSGRKSSWTEETQLQQYKNLYMLDDKTL